MDCLQRVTVIGVGTVRSVYFGHPGEFPQEWTASVEGAARPTDLAEIMALQIAEANGSPVIHQGQNSALNNSLGIVHGGVAATGRAAQRCGRSAGHRGRG
jgi:hypothetical protein